MDTSMSMANPLEQGLPTILVYFDEFGVIRVAANTTIPSDQMLLMLTLGTEMVSKAAIAEMAIRDQMVRSGQLGPSLDSEPRPKLTIVPPPDLIIPK